MSTSIVQNSNDSHKQNSPTKGITKTFLDFYASVETIITQFVRMIVAIASFSIGELAPLAAPLAPSFSIYLAMSQRLNMPAYIALIAAGTIEIVGMYSAKISVRCYRWNSSKSKSEPSVPQGLSILMTAIFFLVVFALALTIELIPSLTALIFPAFTMISISVYVNMAIDQNLRKLETDKANTLELREEKNGLNAQIREAQKEIQTLTEQAKNLTEQVKTIKLELTQTDQELTTKRQEYDNLLATFDTLIAQIDQKKNELVMAQNMVSNGHMTPIKTTNLETANKAKETKIDLRRQEVLRLLEQGMSQADIANELGVSVATVKRDIKILNGRVVTK